VDSSILYETVTGFIPKFVHPKFNFLMNAISRIQYLLFFSFLLFNSLFISASAQNNQLKATTYNIRFANPDDAPNTWENRRNGVVAIIKSSSPDVFGLQEALYTQVQDIEMAFPDFIRIGVGRDDGKKGGEYSPLFINRQKFNILASGTFWLSQTPQVPGSRGWDAACNRVVTWVLADEKQSGKKIWIANTHFDHLGEKARFNSAKLVLKMADSLSGGNPIIVMGDFNAEPESEPYRALTDVSDPLHLTDAANNCPLVIGPPYTFTGFKTGEEVKEHIDYFFLKGDVSAMMIKTDCTHSGTYYYSDHLPVSVILLMN
jgi:endonuclease/exonuclease/phosphatase family metal-dependent hydrolase